MLVSSSPSDEGTRSVVLADPGLMGGCVSDAWMHREPGCVLLPIPCWMLGCVAG